MIRLDFIALWYESMRDRLSKIGLFCGVKPGGRDRAGFDCFVVREHGGMIELDSMVFWRESMGE